MKSLRHYIIKLMYFNLITCYTSSQRFICPGFLKKKAFHFVYSDQGKTYLAEGYGACPTTGYTIEVKELYETEHAVCLHTSLMGPATGEETKEITTFPYIVVEISGTEKEVMFD